MDQKRMRRTASHSSHPTISIAEQPSIATQARVTTSFDIISTKKVLPGINCIRLVTHRSNTSKSNSNSDLEHLQGNLSTKLTGNSSNQRLRKQARLAQNSRKPVAIALKSDSKQFEEESANLDPIYEKSGSGKNIAYFGGDIGLEKISSHIQE